MLNSVTLGESRVKYVYGKRYVRGLGRFVSTTVATLAILTNSAAFTLPFLLTQKAAAVDNYTVDGKIWICHSTSSITNPYEAKNVALDAVDGAGGNDHSSHKGDVFDPIKYNQPNSKGWGDIIPPNPGMPEGMNWTEEGQAYWEENCDGRDDVLGCDTEENRVLTNEDCEEPEEEVPTAKVIANKIVCEDEASLPNWGVDGTGPDLIGADFAASWVTQHPNCSLASDWSYQYRLSDELSEPTGYGEKDGWDTFSANGITAEEDIALDGSKPIQLREVLPEGYIPFTGWTSSNDVSAEFYCHTDVGNYDNWEWISNPLADTTYYCVAWNVPIEQTFKVHASKIICKEESDLPDWGDGADDINATTATNFVSSSQGDCWFPESWQFEWSKDGVGNPGDNLGEQGDNWTTFSTGTTIITLSDAGNKPWFREITDPNYIPFTGQGTEESISAEFYCNSDVLNYDNWEWIESPQANEDYYCVAFNVKKPAILNATKIICDDEIYLPNWGDGSSGPAAINASTADNWLAEDNNDEHCQKVQWNFQWKASQSDDPDDHATNAGAGWNTFSSSSLVWVDAGNYISIREAFDDDYIHFTGQNTTENVSAEVYCGDDVLHYDNWEWISNVQPGQNYYCVAWNVLESVGRIEGLVYHDQNNNSIQEDTEPGMEGWTVWLLTHNSPFKLHAITSTDANGDYVFEHLNLTKNYYVCQDVKSGWFQTQLNLAGLNGINIDTAIVGDVLGDEAALHDLINQFCYEVKLSLENPIATDKDFGNYQSVGRVEGTCDLNGDQIPDESCEEETTEEPKDPGSEGEVLAANTLSDTGDPTIIISAVGLLIVSSALFLTYRSRKQN